MGITGLLPFLEKSSKRTNIRQFSGGTAAIDSYCWLHKGVFSCAEKISMGQQTDAYVNYCMKFIHMLISNKIKPILVFDGRHLPAKAETEVKRRENREKNRRKAIELMRMGQHAEGRSLLRRSLDVTHEMALELIKQCHKINVDCIVAPYEADAQLAYLNINGIADVVITEDSDLTLFGCKKVFFKMDIRGNGLLVDQEKLHLAMDVNSEHFNIDDFRNMCILSGCDYLASLPGIGLNKARKFIRINTDCDIHRALTRLGAYLNMKSLVVTKEYRDAFILAIITFKHQLVFCPLKRQQIRLHPPPPEVTEEQLHYAGVETDPGIALQLAYGNCDPFTFKILHNFDPDKIENRTTESNTWERKIKDSPNVSIWSNDYKVNQNRLQKSSEIKNVMIWPNCSNDKAIIPTKRAKRSILTNQDDNFEDQQLGQQQVLNMYKSEDATNTEGYLELNIRNPDDLEESPILRRKANPFTRQLPNNETSPSLLTRDRARIGGRNIIRLRRTILNEEILTESKFFAKSNVEANNIITCDDKLCSDTNLSSQKENMDIETKSESNNVNLKIFTTHSEPERDLSSMDTNEDCNVSLVSNESNDDRCSTISNCDSGRSHLNLFINESLKNEANDSKFHSLYTPLISSKQNEDPDFLVQQGDLDAFNSEYKWSSAKAPSQVNSKMTKHKGKSSRTPAKNSKTNMTSNVQSQQSLLSMFGFEKKKMN